MFEFQFVDDVICWLAGFTWHIVALITPMMLCMILFGRVVMKYSPLRLLLGGFKPLLHVINPPSRNKPLLHSGDKPLLQKPFIQFQEINPSSTH